MSSRCRKRRKQRENSGASRERQNLLTTLIAVSTAKGCALSKAVKGQAKNGVPTGNGRTQERKGRGTTRGGREGRTGLGGRKQGIQTRMKTEE